MDRRRCLQALGVGGTLSVAGCLGGSDATDVTDVPGGTLRLASATTAYDSGLLDDVLPGFEEQFDATTNTIPRGTGAALRTARDGDCDVVLVHARPLEDEFLRAGFGTNRRTVMRNDFLVVGPPDDPAGAAGSDPLAAFRAIARTESTFLSRGDRSGTHIRERHLWEQAGIDPTGPWYLETGQSMGNTLVAAGQSNAYTLTDRGTFLGLADDRALTAHVDCGIDDPPPNLRNEYGLIPVNPAVHEVAYQLTMAFVGYMTGPGQSRIGNFRAGGERAFRAFGPSRNPDFSQYVPSDWHGPDDQR